MPTEATIGKEGLVKFLKGCDEATSNEMSLALKIPRYDVSSICTICTIFCPFRSKSIAKRGEQRKYKWNELAANIANLSKFCGVKSIFVKPASAKNW
ncbi:MAG: hypothetical protein QXS79_05495 [Candidatus Bathyarchaeia archaeon]